MPSMTHEGPLDLAPIVIDSAGPPGRDGTGGPYLTAFAASMGGIDLELSPAPAGSWTRSPALRSARPTGSA